MKKRHFKNLNLNKTSISNLKNTKGGKESGRPDTCVICYNDTYAPSCTCISTAQTGQVPVCGDI
ncbi:hypothetical protein [Kordia sp.]|uniref:hypothetical protein n=1 Tax=Kordia sp. TaxID=1965332 RepID=UPI003D6A6903